MADCIKCTASAKPRSRSPQGAFLSPGGALSSQLFSPSYWCLHLNCMQSPSAPGWLLWISSCSCSLRHYLLDAWFLDLDFFSVGLSLSDCLWGPKEACAEYVTFQLHCMAGKPRGNLQWGGIGKNQTNVSYQLLIFFMCQLRTQKETFRSFIVQCFKQIFGAKVINPQPHFSSGCISCHWILFRRTRSRCWVWRREAAPARENIKIVKFWVEKKSREKVHKD